MPEEIGGLAEAVLKALNELSRLRASGISESSLTFRKALQSLVSAQTAERAATGSQRGLANLFRAGGSSGSALSGAYMPDPSSMMTPEFSAQHPELANIIGAPSPLESFLNTLGGGGTAGRDIPEAGPAGWVQNYFRTNNTAPLMADPNAEPGGTFAARFGRDFIPQRSPNLGFPSSMGPTGPFLPSQPVTTPGGRTPMPTAQNPNRFSPIGVRSSVQTKKPASRPTPRRR